MVCGSYLGLIGQRIFVAASVISFWSSLFGHEKARA
jgi:hypothetical protein